MTRRRYDNLRCVVLSVFEGLEKATQGVLKRGGFETPLDRALACTLAEFFPGALNVNILEQNGSNGGEKLGRLLN